MGLPRSFSSPAFGTIAILLIAKPIINPSCDGLDLNVAAYDRNAATDTKRTSRTPHSKAISIEVDIGVINAEGKAVTQSVLRSSSKRMTIGPSARFRAHRCDLVEQGESNVCTGPSPFSVSEPSTPGIAEASRHRGER